jgi:hypothetical protein
MRRFLAVLLLIAAPVAAGCSARKMGLNRMADALSSTASAYSRDNDPEFVKLAAPSTLKMVEMLLDDSPAHPGLLMTACSGFTQYAYGFMQVDAEMLEPTDAPGARALRARAARMYDRGRDYCLRALEIRHPGVRQALPRGAEAALKSMTVADVPALYWAGVAWGGGLSLSENQMTRIGELFIVRSLFSRAVALDEGWDGGAIHEAFIALDGLPALVGGSAARAREHFDRAVTLSGGQSAFAYVTLASSVAQPARDRTEFERLLRAAIAVEPSARPRLTLSNLIAQRRARFLLSRIDRLF